jgi:hypothetical protein
MKSPGSRIVFKWLITVFMLISGLLVSTYVYVEQRAGEQALAEAEWQKEAYEQGVRASLLFYPCHPDRPRFRRLVHGIGPGDR